MQIVQTIKKIFLIQSYKKKNFTKTNKKSYCYDFH